LKWQISEAVRNIESKKALNIFPAALQNEIFVKSKLRGKYQKPRIPTKENVWLRVIRSSCPSSFRKQTGEIFVRSLEIKMANRFCRAKNIYICQRCGEEALDFTRSHRNDARLKNLYFAMLA
jgi:hypothetical protein